MVEEKPAESERRQCKHGVILIMSHHGKLGWRIYRQ